MTKTTCVKLLLILSFTSHVFAESVREVNELFSERIQMACGLKIEVNLHDYEYGRDESRLYSNNHFEDTSLLINEIEEACKKNPANKRKLERVQMITFKRGSIQERKLIQRKDGNLVYLANRLKSEQSRHKGDVIRDDLIRVLKLSYETPPDPKVAAQKIEEKKKEEEPDKKAADRDKKIADLTAWYQAEVKKLTANPTAPDFSSKIEKLNKTYEEKLNALITP